MSGHAALANPPSPDEDVLEGSGILGTDERNVPRFTAIDLTCAAQVVVSFAEERNLSVVADDNVLALIETRVEAGTLHVRLLEPFVSVNPVMVQVSTTGLLQVNATAGGIIDMRHPEGEALSVHLLGEAVARAFGEGKIGHLVATVKGKGTIRLGSVTVRSAELKVQGAGRIEARVKERVSASVLGSGKIRVTGNPSQRKTDLKGSGKITFG